VGLCFIFLGPVPILGEGLFAQQSGFRYKNTTWGNDGQYMVWPLPPKAE